MQQNEFQHIPATFWVYLLLPFTVIVLTLLGASRHNPFIFGLIGVIPFAILLVNRIDLWLVTIFAVYNSNLRVPGLLGQLELFHVLIAGLIGVVFLRWIIQKQGASRKGWMWKFIYLFGAVLVVTIAVRGTGFRFLGDTQWGGMRYVEVFLTLSFLFVVTQLQLTLRQWRVAIVSMSLLALVPAVADVVFIVTNGAIYQHYYLIKSGGAVGAAFHAYDAGEMTRFTSAASGGAAVVMLPFILFPLTARNAWKYIAMILAGLALVSTAGFRLGIIRAFAFVWLYMFIAFKGRRMFMIFSSILISAFALALVIALMPHLPLSVQRAFSFITFANVDPTVANSAYSTIYWRLTVWRNALSEIPDYWLMGKGYTYDPQVLASFMENRAPEDWARIQVAYHNGPLSLLIGMGVVGLFAGLGLMVTAAVRHYRLYMSTWYDASLKRFHGVFLALMLIHVGVFLTLYGDVYVSFPGLFKLIAILEGLALANRVLQARDVQIESSAPSEPPPIELPRPRVIRPGF